MKTIQLSITDAIQERDKGISQAVTNADRVHSDWSERAYEMFKTWLAGWASGHKFLVEDFRFSAELRGLERPPSNRAYGFLTPRAKREGLIIQAGTQKVKNVKAHRANAACWQKV